jgi:hypothetical protein
MHITDIHASGIKGRTFSQSLTRAVLVHGPNFSGKTTLISAIRLGILGYIPELGATNAATAKLGNGHQFGVRLKFDDGSTLGRDFRVTGDKVSALCSNPGLAERLDSSLLNQSEYFGLNPRERQDYVFTRSTCEVLNPENAVAKIMAEIRNVELDENTELTEKARTNIIDKCTQAFALHDPQTAITKLTEDKVGILKVEGSSWNKKATDSLGAVRTLSDLKTREAECSAASIEEVEEKIKTAEERQKEAQRALGALENQEETARRTSKRKAEIEEKLNEPDPEPEIEKQESLIAEAKLRLSEQNPGETTAEEWGKKVRFSNSEVTRLSNQIEEERAKRERLSLELDEIVRWECCPNCGGKPKGWKKKLQDAAEFALNEQNATLTTLRGQLDKAIATDQKTAEEFRQFETIVAARAVLDEIIEKAKKRIEEVRKAVAERASYQRELATIQLTPAPAAETLEAARTEELNATRELNGLKDKLKDATRLAQSIKNAEQAAQEHNQAVAYVKVIKAIGTKLKERKAKMVAEVFEQVCKDANAIFPFILPSPLAYHDDALGRWDGSTFIQHDTFSGTEEALTYVAIAAALSSKSPFRILMLDEMGRLDAINKPRVMQALGSALANNLLDQVVLVDVANPALSDREGLWTIINTGVSK